MLEPERILRLEEDAVVLLDQRLLPLEEVEVRCETVGALAEAIEHDGRPRRAGDRRRRGLRHRVGGLDTVRILNEADRVLRASRPTAVNLAWALDEMRDDPSYEHARAHSR